MRAYRSWYREKMHFTIENAPESMLRELLLFAEVLRHRLRQSETEMRHIVAPVLGPVPVNACGPPPIDA